MTDTREDTLKNYLPEGLNVAKMRRTLIEDMHKAGLKTLIYLDNIMKIFSTKISIMDFTNPKKMGKVFNILKYSISKKFSSADRRIAMFITTHQLLVQYGKMLPVLDKILVQYGQILL